MKKRYLRLTAMTLGMVLLAAFLRHTEQKKHRVLSQKDERPAAVIAKQAIQDDEQRPTQDHEIPHDSPAKLVKIDENGNRIYKVDDTQISVSENGELLFLPSKI